MSQGALFDEPGPDLGDVEAWCLAAGLRTLVGVDEAGRGPLAGPVYAAAVVLDLDALDSPWISLLDDSKKLTAERREEAAAAIRERSLAWAIAAREAAIIDEINILQATLRAMEEAVTTVVRGLAGPPDRILIDGNTPIVSVLPQQTLVGGDARSLSIAAASILAKTARDEVMVRHHQRWPEYAFDSNKGYGTAAHRRAIAEVGPCSVHRLTFGGVKEHVHRLRR